MNKKLKIAVRSVVCALIITVIISMLPFQAACKEIQSDVFRLHILANSDSNEDQRLKLTVRDGVLEYTEHIFKNAASKDEAISAAGENLQLIANRAKSIVEENGYDYDVSVMITDEFFTTRTYGDVTMPSGTYPALRIIIGEGKGHNWWCVMYPSLCVGASADYSALRKNTSESEYMVMTAEKREYKFKIVEYYEMIVHALTSGL